MNEEYGATDIQEAAYTDRFVVGEVEMQVIMNLAAPKI